MEKKSRQFFSIVRQAKNRRRGWRKNNLKGTINRQNEAVIFKNYMKRERERERRETKKKLNLQMKNLLFYRQIYQRKSYFVVNVSINQSVGFKISGFFAASIFFSPSCYFFVEKSPAEMIEWFWDEFSVRQNWINFSIFSSFSLYRHSPCAYTSCTTNCQDILSAFKHKECL